MADTEHLREFSIKTGEIFDWFTLYLLFPWSIFIVPFSASRSLCASINKLDSKI